MNNAVVSTGGQVMSQEAWNVMRDQANTLIKSGFLPKAIQKPEQAVAIAVAGKELGIPMMQAFRQINVINGQVASSVQLMLALARRTGELEDMKMTGDDKGCTVVIKRRGQSPYTSKFTLADANKMNLLGKYNWKSMPGTMLQWRALSANLRITFPDAICGIYTAEELGGDMDADGNPVSNVNPIPDAKEQLQGKPSGGTFMDEAEPEPEPKTRKRSLKTSKKATVKSEPEPMIKKKVEAKTKKEPKESKKTENYAFLQEMTKQKGRVGEEAYYKILKEMGFEHSNEITSTEQQTNVWYELKEVTDQF